MEGHTLQIQNRVTKESTDGISSSDCQESTTHENKAHADSIKIRSKSKREMKNTSKECVYYLNRFINKYYFFNPISHWVFDRDISMGGGRS